MYSSVEVLRVLPLDGIAPVGRGGETGQQAVYRSGRKQIKANNGHRRKRFSEVRKLESPLYHNRDLAVELLFGRFAPPEPRVWCISHSATRGKPGSPWFSTTGFATDLNELFSANLRKSYLRPRTGKNRVLSRPGADQAAPGKPPASKTSLT